LRPPATGHHPHSDRPNWQPAQTAEDYLRNIDDGLEDYSERRMAKLLGVSRTTLWRWKWMGEIPDELFERLLDRADHVPSTKEFANIGRALSGHRPAHDVERCPHCGEVLRMRGRWRSSTARIVNEWLSDRA